MFPPISRNVEDAKRFSSKNRPFESSSEEASLCGAQFRDIFIKRSTISDLSDPSSRVRDANFNGMSPVPRGCQSSHFAGRQMARCTTRNVHRCIMQFRLLLLAEGWRDSVLGAPRRLLVTLGSLSRDSSPCPAAVSRHFVHPLSTEPH